MQLELSGKKYELSMFPRDLFPIGFDFETLILMCSMSRTHVRRLLLIRRFPLHAIMKEGVKSLCFCLEHEHGMSEPIIPFSGY